MQTFAFAPVTDSPTGTLRELAERLLKSCTRKPVDVNRWPEWRRGRRDLSFEMIDNCLAAGGRREYARALYLQKAAELIDPIAPDVPQIDECQRLWIEADVRTDRVRQLVLLDGRITDEECSHLETTVLEEQSAMGKLLERLRRSRRYLSQRMG